MIPKGQFAHSSDEHRIESSKTTSLKALVSQELLSNSYRAVWLSSLLIILATFYTLYLTKTLLLPILISAFLSVLLSPIIYRLEKLKIPRSVSSAALLILLIGAIITAGNSVIPAAQDFVEDLPVALGKIDERVAKMSSQLDVSPKSAQAKKNEPTMSTQAVSYITYEFFVSAPIVAVQLMSIVFLVYFTSVFGSRLFRKTIRSIPTYSTRRMVVSSLRRVQQQVTRYVLVISIINLGLGLTLGFILWLSGIENYFLWGVAAFLLNFIPYLGPLITALAMSFGVYIEMGTLDSALLALGLFATLNLLESQIVTPLALSAQLRLNPLLLFMWVMLWGWIWGAAGMFICVPLLVCLKLILSASFPANPWVSIIDS